MRTHAVIHVILLVAALHSRPASGQVSDRQALLQLNRQLLESVFLRQDTSLLAATAVPDLLVVPPGGIVENKRQLLAGARNTVMDSVRVDDEQVIGDSATAVVVARVTRLGPVPGDAGTGRMRIMNVYVRSQGRWRLLARSVTPCIERAVAAGRC